MTIDKLLKESKLPAVEKEILLAYVLRKDRSYLKGFGEKVVSSDRVTKYRNLIARREKHEPIAYILGYKEFYGLKFLVNSSVLIPREETETLVTNILKVTKGGKLTVVDVGTGSGCIAIALAVNNPDLTIYATDKSSQALKVAKKNAVLHKVDKRITFLESDLLDDLKIQVDIFGANLPYIPTRNWEVLPSEIKNFEPRLALDSGKSDKELYDKLFEQSAKILKPGGKVFYEIAGEIFTRP